MSDSEQQSELQPIFLLPFPSSLPFLQTWEHSALLGTFFQRSTGNPELGHFPCSCFPLLTEHGGRASKPLTGPGAICF